MFGEEVIAYKDLTTVCTAPGFWALMAFTTWNTSTTPSVLHLSMVVVMAQNTAERLTVSLHVCIVISTITVEPSKKGHFGNNTFVLSLEVVEVHEQYNECGGTKSPWHKCHTWWYGTQVTVTVWWCGTPGTISLGVPNHWGYQITGGTKSTWHRFSEVASVTLQLWYFKSLTWQCPL